MVNPFVYIINNHSIRAKLFQQRENGVFLSNKNNITMRKLTISRDPGPTTAALDCLNTLCCWLVQRPGCKELLNRFTSLSVFEEYWVKIDAKHEQSLKTWLQAPTLFSDNLRVLGESSWPCEYGKIPADSSRCEMRRYLAFK
eukprot:sb/3474138/